MPVTINGAPGNFLPSSDIKDAYNDVKGLEGPQGLSWRTGRTGYVEAKQDQQLSTKGRGVREDI